MCGVTAPNSRYQMEQVAPFKGSKVVYARGAARPRSPGHVPSLSRATFPLRALSVAGGDVEGTLSRT